MAGRPVHARTRKAVKVSRDIRVDFSNRCQRTNYEVGRVIGIGLVFTAAEENPTAVVFPTGLFTIHEPDLFSLQRDLLAYHCSAVRDVHATPFYRLSAAIEVAIKHSWHNPPITLKFHKSGQRVRWKSFSPYLPRQKKSIPNTTLRPGMITPGISSYCVSVMFENTRCADMWLNSRATAASHNPYGSRA